MIIPIQRPFGNSTIVTSILSANLPALVFCETVLNALGFTGTTGKLTIRFKNPRKVGFVKVKIGKECAKWCWDWSAKGTRIDGLGCLFYNSVGDFLNAYFKPSRFPFVVNVWVKAEND
jgi:hypothetical protein